MNSKVRHIIYGIISFVLSFVLFLLSFAIVLQSTILNPSYIMDNMNTSNYFVDKRDEIKESLVNLGYASGLDEKFFENVVDEVTIHDNTQAYLNSFYAGEEAKIDTTTVWRRSSPSIFRSMRRCSSCSPTRSVWKPCATR